MSSRKMTWQYESTENGNVALTGEVDIRPGEELTLAAHPSVRW